MPKDTPTHPPEELQYGNAEVGALAHLYRGEMYRSKIWRTRLDATTNWAVVTVGIAISVSFADQTASSLPIVLVGGLLLVFLGIEARRYRFFDIFRTRVRVMETSFYGPILMGRGMDVTNGWNKTLLDDYTGLYFHISMAEAVGRRLRRNFIWIFGVQLGAYLGKLIIHPIPLRSLDALFVRASIGPVPGEVVLVICAVFYTALVVFALWSLRFHAAAGRARSPEAHSRRMRDLTATEIF